ncbi:MAG: hypothetical protein EOO88_07195 [Pedobacter sp.]|nr:MAG: hypothetical protein EOO88_07195 [Pedobacter sp.]
MSHIFIHPDTELNVQLIRVLSILDKMSFNRNNSPVLHLEKIAVFDFLLRHPGILFGLLKKTDKKVSFILEDFELNAIGSLYPSRDGLYQYEDHRKLLQLLLIHGFTNVRVTQTGELFYVITDQGRGFLDQIDSKFAFRQRELASGFAPIQSQTTKNLLAQIIPFINGK